MIGDRLKELREKRGMNKKEFADYLGLKYTTYNNYETEARDPASDFLILVSDRLDVSIDYLLGRKDESDVMRPYQLRKSEYEHIKSYRTLDAHGKRMVDFVLNEEANRVAIDAVAKSKAELKPYEVLQAAHENAEGATEEQKKHADDIMMDDSEWE